MEHSGRWLVGLGAVFVALFGFGACADAQQPEPRAAQQPAPSVAPVPVRPSPLTIVNRHDAATYTLSDGRVVRLAGIVVDPPGTCRGDAALAGARALAPDGYPVTVTPGGTDEHGNRWVVLVPDYQIGPGQDLAVKLALGGHADSYPGGGAEPGHAATIQASVADAKLYGYGRWGDQCQPLQDIASDPGGNTDDFDAGGGDDGGESRFCRGRWWC